MRPKISHSKDCIGDYATVISIYESKAEFVGSFECLQDCKVSYNLRSKGNKRRGQVQKVTHLDICDHHPDGALQTNRTPHIVDNSLAY